MCLFLTAAICLVAILVIITVVVKALLLILPWVAVATALAGIVTFLLGMVLKRSGKSSLILTLVTTPVFALVFGYAVFTIHPPVPPKQPEGLGVLFEAPEPGTDDVRLVLPFSLAAHGLALGLILAAIQRRETKKATGEAPPDSGRAVPLSD